MSLCMSAIRVNTPLGVEKYSPMGEMRLARITANREIFEAARQPYQEALTKGG